MINSAQLMNFFSRNSVMKFKLNYYVVEFGYELTVIHEQRSFLTESSQTLTKKVNPYHFTLQVLINQYKQLVMY